MHLRTKSTVATVGVQVQNCLDECLNATSQSDSRMCEHVRSCAIVCEHVRACAIVCNRVRNFRTNLFSFLYHIVNDGWLAR